jgi:hypothetical protein
LEQALEEKSTPIYLQKGRVISRKNAVAEVTRDVAVQRVEAVSTPNYPEQTSEFASDLGSQQGSAVPVFPPAVIGRIQR